MSSPQTKGISPRRWWIAGALLLLVVFCVATRTIPNWPNVFPETGEVRLLGVDSYYHLRHSKFAAKHFPHLQRWDQGTHYPTGDYAEHPSLFNVLIGGGSLALSWCDLSSPAIEYFSAWLPIILTVLMLLTLFTLARTFLRSEAALLACAFFALYPGESLGRTQLGFADHHAAEIFLLLLTTLGLVRCLKASDATFQRPLWRVDILTALPMALFLFTWRGAPITLSLVYFALFLIIVVGIALDESAQQIGRAGFRYALGLFAILALTKLVWPELVMDRHLFRRVLESAVVVAGGCLLLPFVSQKLQAKGQSPKLVAGLLAAILLVIAVLGFALLPRVRELIGIVLTEKTGVVKDHADLDFRTYWNWYGPSGMLAVLSLPLGLRAVWKRDAPSFVLAPLLMGSSALALTLQTDDYGYQLGPQLALLAAFVVQKLYFLAATTKKPETKKAKKSAKSEKTKKALPIRPIVVGLIVVAPIWPLHVARAPWSTAKSAKELLFLHSGWPAALEWIKSNTPEPTLAIDARVDPWGPEGFAYPNGTYGVMVAWEYGNFVNLIAKRVPVWSHGVDYETIPWWFEETEAASFKYLCPKCEGDEEVRYAIVDVESATRAFLAKARIAGHSADEYRKKIGNVQYKNREVPLLTYGDAYEHSMAVRLHRDDGQGLEHYRLVYESPHQSLSFYNTVFRNPVTGEKGIFHSRDFVPMTDPGAPAMQKALSKKRAAPHGQGFFHDGALASSVKVFEIVPGLHLTATSTAGSHATARLQMRSGKTKRTVQYEQTATANNDGVIEMTLPYPSQASGGTDFRPLGPWQIQVVAPGSAALPPKTFVVSEEQVRTGARLDLGPVP